MTLALLRGPLIVVVVSKGLISACFFHLTRAAAERRQDDIVSKCSTCTVRVYNLPELLECFHRAEEEAVAELERMSKL